MTEIPRFPITGPKVWAGSDIAARSDWRRPFDSRCAEELDQLLASLHAGGTSSANSAPVPGLRALMTQVHDDLIDGLGFVLVSGFPVERYDAKDIESLFLALGRLIGTPISQNSYGDLLGHVRDEGKRVNTKGDTRGVRGYLSNEELLFHADLGDAVGLLCIRKALEGGMSSISSSMMVYNEILKTHPEYLPVYFNGFAFRSTEADGAPIEWRLPIYSYHEGKLSCAIRRMAIETSRLNGLPYTDIENLALEFLDKTAARADLRYDMQLEPGDIQFLNNFTTFHARTNFVDADDPKQKRELLRLWLQFPDGRSFLRRYPTIYDGVPCTMKRSS